MEFSSDKLVNSISTHGFILVAYNKKSVISGIS